MSLGRLPDITHLQFLVLGLLLGAESSGRQLRQELSRLGVRRTMPAFYQMMARLEDGGLVEGWYDQKIVSGQIIKERRYKLTASGSKAWTATREFYLKAARDKRFVVA
jgi:DNA-binding PadR family transcriptional regulator